MDDISSTIQQNSSKENKYNRLINFIIILIIISFLPLFNIFFLSGWFMALNLFTIKKQRRIIIGLKAFWANTILSSNGVININEINLS